VWGYAVADLTSVHHLLVFFRSQFGRDRWDAGSAGRRDSTSGRGLAVIAGRNLIVSTQSDFV
jgi:hypothetical protein